MNNEALGPAERIIQTALAYSDHMFHNRPGVVTQDAASVTGVKWAPVTHKEIDGKKVVFRLDKVGKKTNRVQLGTLWQDGTVRDDNRRKLGDYRKPGMFPEVAAWLYKQVAEVWKLDNEFAARWASYAFVQEHRDLKVVLAAFMLVQSRKGDPVRDGDEVVFYDDDFRDVGEAMLLLYRKDKRSLDAKLLLRIRELLSLPEVAALNRELGFGRSPRKPFLGRWPQAVRRWLRYREENLKVLEGLVKSGQAKMLIQLAKGSRYKPLTPKFFEVLGWPQDQASTGHREVAIGQEIGTATTQSWEGLSEEQVCEQIVADKPNYKRLVGMLPKGLGLTRAIMAAAVESGCLSDKDLIIQAPTLEELGLLQVQEVRERWERALKNAEDQRAANIALRLKSKEAQEKHQEAADTAVQKAVEEQVRGLRVYFIVDISASMSGAIAEAKGYIEKFLQGFPPEQLHVSVFNTSGREIKIKHASAAGVQQAFRGIAAGGGTDYGAGVRVLQGHKPKPEEDALFIFVGDEEAQAFPDAVRTSGLNPMAFGLIRMGRSNYRAVQDTASQLGIPCFMIDQATFQDPYAIPRTVKALVAATPVGQVVGQAPRVRVTLVDQILQTELLKKPIWADATAA